MEVPSPNTPKVTADRSTELEPETEVLPTTLEVCSRQLLPRFHLKCSDPKFLAVLSFLGPELAAAVQSLPVPGFLKPLTIIPKRLIPVLFATAEIIYCSYIP